MKKNFGIDETLFTFASFLITRNKNSIYLEIRKMKNYNTNIAITTSPMGNGYYAAPDYGDGRGAVVF